MPDIITSLGYLCLGSRFKRLGERLQAGVTEILAARGYQVHPAQLPILMALDLHGDAPVGLLSQHVGISQPGITRAVTQLRKLGLVETAAQNSDRRQTVLTLSHTGKALMTTLRESLYPSVERAVAGACDGMAGDLLADLAALEAALDHIPLARRIDREAGR